MKEIFSILNDFKKKKIAVIGDIMLDHYLEGMSSRVSPEAPIPVILVKKEWFAAGGAGNTAVNIVELGGRVVLFGTIGEDQAGFWLHDEFLRRKIENKAGTMFGKTIEKLRIYLNGKQVVRADKDDFFCPEGWQKNTEALVGLDIEKWDAVLVSDYDKGFVNEHMARELVCITKENKKILIVDTKPEHFLWFKNCYCIKPNKVEAEKFTGIKIEELEDAEKAGLRIKKELQANVLLTLGSMGMMLFEEECTTHFSSNAKDVFDVTGAGDTVLAAFALALSSGANMKQAVDLANHAAAIVVGKSGTAPVTLDELKNSLS